MASRRRVVKVLADLVEAGAGAKKIARMLAAYLLETRQARQADLYLRDFRAELEQRFGIATAEVTSAHNLSAQLNSQVEKFVAKASGAKEVEIISQVNPELISGMVISLTDREYVGSLSRRIKNLRAI
jgi:F0F1-type ATP synthase delta subunit